MTVKKINAWLHLWLGLASGLVMLILGLTGCALVFEQEIKLLSTPWLHAVAPKGNAEVLLPSELYRSVESTLPGREIESIWYYGKNRTAQLKVHGSDSTVYVNPYTGSVIAIASSKDIFKFFKDGHYYLWMPKKIGSPIVGWGTLIFFLLVLSGLVLWWPKRWNRKSREQAFQIRVKAKFKRLNYDLHNVLGFYALTIALLLAFTGLIMSFSWFNNGVYQPTGGEIKPWIKPVSDTLSNPTQLTQQQMLKQVDKAYLLSQTVIAEHNPDQLFLHFPDKPADPIYLCTDLYKGSWRDVFLDQHTLKQLPASSKRLRDDNLASWLRRSNYGLHVGAMGGLPTKILFFLVSLICASLPVTGFYIWWGNKKKDWKKNKKTKISAIADSTS
jgi:uncharacterized iron-regulated membrane protein